MSAPPPPPCPDRRPRSPPSSEQLFVPVSRLPCIYALDSFVGTLHLHRDRCSFRRSIQQSPAAAGDCEPPPELAYYNSDGFLLIEIREIRHNFNNARELIDVSGSSFKYIDRLVQIGDTVHRSAKISNIEFLLSNFRVAVFDIRQCTLPLLSLFIRQLCQYRNSMFNSSSLTNPHRRLKHLEFAKPQSSSQHSPGVTGRELFSYNQCRVVASRERCHERLPKSSELVTLVNICAWFEVFPRLERVRDAFGKLCHFFSIPSASKYKRRMRRFTHELVSSGWLRVVNSYLESCQRMVDESVAGAAGDWVVLWSAEENDSNLRAVCALLRVMCDPTSRTVHGFHRVLDEEWFSDAATFALPHHESFSHNGLNTSKSTESLRAQSSSSAFARHAGRLSVRLTSAARPKSQLHHTHSQVPMEIFLLFLDTVHQLVILYPRSFQFSQMYLVSIWHTLLKTGSIPPAMFDGCFRTQQDIFSNPLYRIDGDHFLKWNIPSCMVELWDELFCYWLKDRSLETRSGAPVFYLNTFEARSLDSLRLHSCMSGGGGDGGGLEDAAMYASLVNCQRAESESPGERRRNGGGGALIGRSLSFAFRAIDSDVSDSSED